MLTEDFEQLINKIANLEKDYTIVVEDTSLETDYSNSSETKKPDLRAELREAIKPQVDIILSLLPTISSGFEDNLTQTKRMEEAIDQINSWRDTVYGVCEQVVKTVESKIGNLYKEDALTNNPSKCSPMAFNKYICDCKNSRYNLIQLMAAVMVFYNSLA